MAFYNLIDNEDDVAVDETENPTAEEVLSQDPDADIFQYNGVIYQTDIDAVKGKSLTKDELVGEIKETNDTDTHFADEIANKLPAGAAIFTTEEEDEMFLIVESEGETLKYYAIVEGE